MRIVLHIGQQKTGTTALQSALVADRARLAQAGICYPDVGHARADFGELRPSHNAVFFKLQGNSGAKLWESIDEIRTRLHAQIERDRPDLLLISAEHAIMADDQSAPVLDGFDALLPGDKEIVVYLRRPDRYVSSLHKQLVRLGRTDLAPLHSPERMADLEATCQLDHKRALGAYIERYGEVRVFNYDTIDDTIDHFYRHVLMLDAPEDRTSVTNPSIPSIFANLSLRHVREHGRLELWQIRALVRHGEREQVDLLGAANRARCLDYYRPHDAFLGSLTGRRGFFDDLDAMVDVSDGHLDVETADERYRAVFEALVRAPNATELRRDCRVLEVSGQVDAADALLDAYRQSLSKADLDWFATDLATATGGRYTLADGHYVDNEAAEAEPPAVRRLAQSAARRTADIARRARRQIRS